MILITGANGQLGTELRYLLDERNEEYVAVDVAEMDITNAQMVDKVFAEVKNNIFDDFYVFKFLRVFRKRSAVCRMREQFVHKDRRAHV